MITIIAFFTIENDFFEVSMDVEADSIDEARFKARAIINANVMGARFSQLLAL